MKRQPGRSVARRVSARLSLRRNLRETNNKFRYLDFTANQPGTRERRAFLHSKWELCGSAFYGGCISRQDISHRCSHTTPEAEDNSGHKQKRHVHIRVTANVSEQPERLHITECMDDEDACGERCRAHRQAAKHSPERCLMDRCLRTRKRSPGTSRSTLLETECKGPQRKWDTQSTFRFPRPRSYEPGRRERNLSAITPPRSVETRPATTVIRPKIVMPTAGL